MTSLTYKRRASAARKRIATSVTRLGRAKVSIPTTTCAPNATIKVARMLEAQGLLIRRRS